MKQTTKTPTHQTTNPLGGGPHQENNTNTPTRQSPNHQHTKPPQHQPAGGICPRHNTHTWTHTTTTPTRQPTGEGPQQETTPSHQHTNHQTTKHQTTNPPTRQTSNHQGQQPPDTHIYLDTQPHQHAKLPNHQGQGPIRKSAATLGVWGMRAYQLTHSHKHQHLTHSNTQHATKPHNP